MQLGYIGLGKMGLAQVERLCTYGHSVVAWNRNESPRREAKKSGADISDTLEEMCARLKTPRLLWLMVAHGAVEEVLSELAPNLSQGDTVVDGGNSFYQDSQRRAKEFARRGIHFLDVGVSGGPKGARYGACLMVGGERKVFKKYKELFCDLSGTSEELLTKSIQKHSYVPTNVGMSREGFSRVTGGGYAYVGRSGAGHFAKMVHNGIEYGMMQALAEGFALLKAADRHRTSANKRERREFGFNLRQISELYNRGSVIESRLVGWLAKAYAEHGENLKDISGEVAHSGEGLWTVRTAKEFSVPVKVIRDALDFRLKSKDKPSYTGQVVSALRNQFGGHRVSKKNTS